MLIGLLEDDLAIQEMLRLVFESEGHAVTIYTNAENCLADLQVDNPQPGPFSPDLLVVDLRLSTSLPGTVVVERMRTNPRLASLPVILMTASTFSDRQELARLHVTLLAKPFDIDEVVQLVNKLTGQEELN
ncbi:MAG TPA: response regulator [Ktedonobacteraceae bacterium]|nr:response regulator [Ktedonobacteraceae bacterium]